MYESSQIFLALVGLTALLGAVVVDAETYFEPQGARIVSRRTGRKSDSNKLKHSFVSFQNLA